MMDGGSRHQKCGEVSQANGKAAIEIDALLSALAPPAITRQYGNLCAVLQVSACGPKMRRPTRHITICDLGTSSDIP